MNQNYWIVVRPSGEAFCGKHVTPQLFKTKEWAEARISHPYSRFADAKVVEVTLAPVK